MPLYQALPVQVEARQWDGTQSAANNLVAWVHSGGMLAYYEVLDNVGRLVVNTLNGPMFMNATDWLVKGPWGFRPERDDILPLIYEEA